MRYWLMGFAVFQVFSLHAYYEDNGIIYFDHFSLKPENPQIMWSNGGIEYLTGELLKTGVIQSKDDALSEAEREFRTTLKKPNTHVFSIIPIGGTIRMGHLWYFIENRRLFLQGVYLEEEYRGKSIGSTILSYLELLCIDLGIKIIDLHVFRHNDRALSLYKKMGYVITSSDQKFHGYLMEKRVGEEPILLAPDQKISIDRFLRHEQHS